MISYNERCNVIVPGDLQEVSDFCVEQFFSLAQEAITDHGYFAVALSGGSTPKSVYQKLTDPTNLPRIDWSRVKLFWSDERAVPPSHPDSNYRMVMEAGFSRLPIPQNQIYRMHSEENIEKGAVDYEQLLKNSLQDFKLDLVLLGLGDDGHTASLFPETHGLHAENRWVVANYIPKLDTWRMSLTYNCINAAHHIVVYVFGKNKASIVKKVFNDGYQPDHYPIQRIGSSSHKAIWILDKEAAAELIQVL